MRMAVIGHVEWIEFIPVDRVPVPGEIVHAMGAWEEPGGGGGVAAVQLAKLAGAADLYTALGGDRLGHRAAEELERLGVTVHAAFRDAAQRRAFTYVDSAGERTITTIGERLGPSGDDRLPWDLLADTAGVYFTAGDLGALRAGRRARALVATAREIPHLRGSGVPLDAVVGSSRDPAERYVRGDLDPVPALAVATEGGRGGRFETVEGTMGRYEPEPPPGPVVDSYGCGDSFAAGLTFGLASGWAPADALSLAARCGAACLTGRGPFEGQLRLVEEPPARAGG